MNFFYWGPIPSFKILFSVHPPYLTVVAGGGCGGGNGSVGVGGGGSGSVGGGGSGGSGR